MKEKKRFSLSIFSFSNYALVFFGVCVITTISALLFTWGAGIIIPREKLIERAVFGFLNIFILSLLFTVSMRFFRKIQIEKPIKQMLSATDAIRKGDFSVRIPERKGLRLGNEFDVIIENLNAMAEELSGVETLKVDFISTVSHELKTPLSVIQNYATILQDTQLPEEKRLEYAKRITEASRRLSSLITNILRLNKLENQQIFPEKKTFNVSEQITECLLDFEAVWEEKDIALDADIEDGIFVRSDAELLSLVWHNLFSNAFKFTQSGGTVAVFLSQKGGEITCTVRDTGCGMSAETQKHIFEKFYQGDTSRATQGNGLGLALVKRVCDITGANVCVESEENAGSVFTVRMAG